MTPHGAARGSFSTWAYEQQRWSEDVIEACLAHKEGDRVKRAYNHATFNLHRAELLAAWAQYIEGGETKQRSRLKAVKH
jgi:integrase